MIFSLFGTTWTWTRRSAENCPEINELDTIFGDRPESGAKPLHKKFW
jgi:hypothetical protein